MKKMQYLSIQILNSRYKLFFNLFLYVIIYIFFNSNLIVDCMKSENIPIIAESKDEIIRNLQKNLDVSQTERNYFREKSAVLHEETLKLSYENKYLKGEIQEQKIILDLEQTRNTILETEKEGLIADLKRQKAINTHLSREIAEIKAKLIEYKNALFKEEIVEASGENSDITFNKKRKN
jgi:hypothetical protein